MLRLPREAQEGIKQSDIQSFRYLALDPSGVYQRQDLLEEDALHHALRLLVQTRFEQDKDSLKLTPHVDYSCLPQKANASIVAKLRVEESQLQEAARIVRSPREL